MALTLRRHAILVRIVFALAFLVLLVPSRLMAVAHGAVIARVAGSTLRCWCGGASIVCACDGVTKIPLRSRGSGDSVEAFANLRRAARDGGELRIIVWRSPADNPFMTVAHGPWLAEGTSDV